MKLKIFAIACVLLISSLSIAQTAIPVNPSGGSSTTGILPSWHNGGFSYTLTAWATDSIGTYLTAEMDISAMDAQTMYLMYDYITPGGTADSVKVRFRGYPPGWSSSSASKYLDLDSQIVIGSTTTNVRQLTLSLTAYCPTVKVYFFPTNRDARDQTRDGTFSFMLYAIVNDAVPTYKRWGQVPY